MMILFRADHRTICGCCVVWITSENTNLRLGSTFIRHLETSNSLLLSRNMRAVSTVFTKWLHIHVPFLFLKVDFFVSYSRISPLGYGTPGNVFTCISLDAVPTWYLVRCVQVFPFALDNWQSAASRRSHFSKFEEGDGTEYTDLSRKGNHEDSILHTSLR